ncbi:hypothetical protein ACE6H2_022082 [Prunus campanulata]
MGLNPSFIQKAGLQGKQVSGATQTINPNQSGRRCLSWKAKARATQPVSKAQKGDENPQQSELNNVQLEILTKTGHAKLALGSVSSDAWLEEDPPRPMRLC